MPFSTCGPDRRRGSIAGRRAGLGLAALVLVWAHPVSSQSLRTWVSAGSGYESDLIVDPIAPQTSIPGGAFLQLSPGVGFGSELGSSWQLRSTAHVGWQQYVEEGRRSLVAPQVWVDAVRVSRSPWRQRLSGGASFFDDSERETVRRFGVAGEAALGWESATLTMEAIAAADLRHYPRLEFTGGDGSINDYQERSGSLGTRIRWRPAIDFDAELQLSHLWSEARDVDYEAGAWSLRSNLRWTFLPRLRAEGTFAWQQRNPEDPLLEQDVYSQFGLGVRWLASSVASVGARWAYAEYEWPAGEVTDTHRIEFAITRSFGARGLVPKPVSDPRLDDRGRVLFRLHAPEALDVRVTGDFTQWRQGRALSRISEGWWELSLTLPPGLHQYVYLVDGEVRTPPEAPSTVEDGFGGRNGLIEVPDL